MAGFTRHKVGYRFKPGTLATLAALQRLHPDDTKTAIVERALEELLQAEREQSLVAFPGPCDPPPAAG